MIADYRTLPVGKKKKWCSCIGRNHKLAVSYAFGNSLVVHGSAHCIENGKVNGCCVIQVTLFSCIHPFNEENFLRDCCNSLKCTWTVEHHFHYSDYLFFRLLEVCIYAHGSMRNFCFSHQVPHFLACLACYDFSSLHLFENYSSPALKT